MGRWPPYGGGREGRFDCIYIIYIYIILYFIYIYIHTYIYIYIILYFIYIYTHIYYLFYLYIYIYIYIYIISVNMATKDTKRKEQPGYTDNWQKGKSLIASLSYSLEENILCDVTFVVGETRECVRAHRLILSLRSCVFLAMLTGLMAEQDDIEIPDIGADIFNTFLK